MIVLHIVLIFIIGLISGMVVLRSLQKIRIECDGMKCAMKIILFNSLLFISFIPGLIMYNNYSKKNNELDDVIAGSYDKGYLKAVEITKEAITNSYDYCAFMYRQLNLIPDDVKKQKNKKRK